MQVKAYVSSVTRMGQKDDTVMTYMSSGLSLLSLKKLAAIAI